MAFLETLGNFFLDRPGERPGGYVPSGDMGFLRKLALSLDPEAAAKYTQGREVATKDSELAKVAGTFGQPGVTPQSILAKMAGIDPAYVSPLVNYNLKQQEMNRPDYSIQTTPQGDIVAVNKNNPKEYTTVYDAPAMPDVKGEMDLRKEFDSLNKDFRTVRDAYTRTEASAANPSAAGDLALVFNYMKILDPGSTVREGEFANAQNATGVPQAVINLYNRAMTGERLNPEQRQDFVGRARMLYNAQAQNYNTSVDQFRGLATQYGYDPARIAKPAEIKEISAAKAPATVIKLDENFNVIGD